MGSILVLFTIALLGVGVSVLSLSAKGEEFLDPILLFLLISYPVIVFFAVYTQLRITKFRAVLLSLSSASIKRLEEISQVSSAPAVDLA